MKIGDLAQKARTSVETIRFYEQQGLMPEPGRTSGNFRTYEEAHVERLSFIRHCRALDMSHDEIRVLLDCMDQPASPCDGVNKILDEHIDHVSRRIAELMHLKSKLLSLRATCQGDSSAQSCGILHGLASLTSDGHSHPRDHVKLVH